MSIQADVIELRELDVEIKRVRKTLTVLRERKEQCEARILTYLDVNEQPGLKMGGMVIMAENRRRRKYEKKADKIARGEEILQRDGIYNSRETLDKILEAMRGTNEEKPSLKIY